MKQRAYFLKRVVLGVAFLFSVAQATPVQIQLPPEPAVLTNAMQVRVLNQTEAARHLQEARLIHYTRGHIAVLDRPGTEARACECYAVVKREYDRLLRPHSTAQRLHAPHVAPVSRSPYGCAA